MEFIDSSRADEVPRSQRGVSGSVPGSEATNLARICAGLLRSAFPHHIAPINPSEGSSMSSERRRFIAKAGGMVAAAAAAAIVDAPNVLAHPNVRWRMSTTWTPALDVLQGGAQRLAKVVEAMSGGRFQIEVFPGDT